MWEGKRGEDKHNPPVESLHHHHHHHHHVHHAMQPMPSSYGAYTMGLGYPYPPATALNPYTLHHSAIPTAQALQLQGLGPAYPTKGALSESSQYLDGSYDHRRVRRRLSSEERLERNRERNRMHAKKTRQRKKQHMTELTQVRKELEDQQRKLKQAINERKTAKILLVMSASGVGEDKPALLDSSSSSENELNSRMDGSHHHLKMEADSPGRSDYQQMDRDNGSDNSDSDTDHSTEMAAASKPPAAGDHSKCNGSSSNGTAINYALLKKDRALCTPQELDEIRRERNRMHARRTRERKKKLLKQAQTHVEALERENKRLQQQLRELDGIVMPHGKRGDGASSIHHALPPLTVATPSQSLPSSGTTTSSSHNSSGMSSGSSSGGESKGGKETSGMKGRRQQDGGSDTSSDSGASDEVMMSEMQWGTSGGSSKDEGSA